MADIIRRDERILTDKEQGVLKRTLEKLEQFFPDHNVFAFDALCPTQSKDSSALSKKLGYESVKAFLNAYGFTSISGPEVYEIRKDSRIKPGEEPEYIKGRIDSAIQSLNEFYPDHVINGSIQKEHKKLAGNLTGFWQWLGYKSLGDMLTAYGFTYSIDENASKGGRPSTVNPDAVIEELKKRYPEGTEMTAIQIKDANPDLKMKTVMNKAQELFGMTFTNYLVEQGIIIGKKVKSAEEIEAEKKAESLECLSEFDKLLQKEFAGWKPLPVNSAELIDELDNTTSKKKLKRAIESLGVNPDEHFADLNLIATEETDNELRELIQQINFEKLIKGVGLTSPSAKNVGINYTPSTMSDKPQNTQNWDKANNDRITSASNEQVKWIMTIIKAELGRDVSPNDPDVELGMKSLPQNLKEIALLRLKKPEASLTEIGQMLTTPVGKAGVYKRLEKIHDLAIEIMNMNKETS